MEPAKCSGEVTGMHACLNALAKILAILFEQKPEKNMGLSRTV